MESRHQAGHPRTLLGELIRQRRQTAEEFSADAERFARERGIRATLSPRHVQRLITGRRANGEPLGPVRPVTRRLLEAMLGVPIEQLLRPPAPLTEGVAGATDSLELRARLAAGRSTDLQMVALLRKKLDLTRVMDRSVGARALLGELREHIRQTEELLRDTLTPAVRMGLAEVLVDASALAGWQSLDQGLLRQAWNHYDRARTAAREANSTALEAYACAAQAVVLLDVGETTAAVELTGHALDLATDRTPAALRAWVTAGRGEALAATGDQRGALLAFDRAEELLSESMSGTEVPFLVFDATHLARWRGSALARLRDRQAVSLLNNALDQLDPSFKRAETALRVDLVEVLSASDEREAAAEHVRHARLLAEQIGSVRQRNRLALLSS